MAAISTPVGSTLKLVVQTGMDDEGKPIIRTRSYNRVKVDAQDDNVLEVAKNLADLQAHPVNAIRRVMEFELTEEG